MPTRPLSYALQKVAETELKEDPERKWDRLSHINKWSEKQPHFNIRTDQQLFLGFLRSCKFSLENTKERLENYYTVRGLMPEYFSDRDPLLPEIQRFLNEGGVVPLPNTKDSVGPRIYFFRWREWDPQKMTLINFVKTYFMIMDILLREDDNSTVSGIQIVCDFKHFSPRYIAQMTPKFFKNTFHCLESAYPCRIKAMVAINVPPIFETVYKLMSPFMSAKLKERFYAFSSKNLLEFYKLVPQLLLPDEYGGEAGAIEELTRACKEKVESYRRWLLVEERYGTIEALRNDTVDECGYTFLIMRRSKI